MMTPTVRAFHERHIEEDADPSETSDDTPLDSDGSAYGYSHDEDTMAEDEGQTIPPILEEDAFAHLVDSYFGVQQTRGDQNKQWDELEREARTPLFEGAPSSR